MKRKALGKGLRSLIPDAPARANVVRMPEPAPESREGLRSIDLDRIRPNPKQPRKGFSQPALETLAESIRLDGLLQPVIGPDVYERYAMVW